VWASDRKEKTIEEDETKYLSLSLKPEGCWRPSYPGFFLSAKVADIFEISFLSPGSDKI
jgi:hypothetical protein